jgi:uncharacterized protein YecE (DUF72 family)
MAIQVGCGSWTDPEYVGVLYPPGLPATERLSAYARCFDHVEVNASFYATPDAHTIAKWEAMTPPGFLFDFKLHKTLSRHGTRMGDLPGPLRLPGAHPMSPLDLSPALQAEIVAHTLERLQPLIAAKKLGAFLLLLTPRFHPEKDRMEELDPLVEALRDHPLAVELRQRAWVEGKALASTLAYFRERGITWVAVDMPLSNEANVMPAIDEVTQPKLGYLRLHGRNEQGYLHGTKASERFHYDYSEMELHEIVTRIQCMAAQAQDLRVVASNHAEDFAPKAALRIKQLLGQKVTAPGNTQMELL